jgi:hypothetical protein
VRVGAVPKRRGLRGRGQRLHLYLQSELADYLEWRSLRSANEVLLRWLP